jgi:hypothetical protein
MTDYSEYLEPMLVHGDGAPLDPRELLALTAPRIANTNLPLEAFMPLMHLGYVRDREGRFFLQLPSGPPHGIAIVGTLSDELVGVTPADLDRWGIEPLAQDDPRIPPAVRAVLDPILQEYLD